MGRHPQNDVIFATYGQELSDDFGRRVRNRIANPVHQAIFPNSRLSEDSTAAHRFNTTVGGAYYAVGTGGPIGELDKEALWEKALRGCPMSPEEIDRM